MRGVFSILFSSSPDVARFRTGVLLLSCSERYDERIAQRVCEWLPEVRWAIVKRFEPAFPWFKGESIFSSYAATAGQQWQFFRSLRRCRYDVAVITCTNEKSYNSLKTLGVLSGAGALVVFNENIDAYIACRDTRRTIVNHIRWRLRQRKYLTGRNTLLEFLSWVFLFPPAFLYLLWRTLILVIGKQIRRS